MMIDLSRKSVQAPEFSDGIFAFHILRKIWSFYHSLLNCRDDTQGNVRPVDC